MIFQIYIYYPHIILEAYVRAEDDKQAFKHLMNHLRQFPDLPEKADHLTWIFKGFSKVPGHQIYYLNKWHPGGMVKMTA